MDRPIPRTGAVVTSSILAPILSPRERSQRGILAGLQDGTGKHVYGGTVSPATKARRRKANKAARIARRASRG